MPAVEAWFLGGRVDGRLAPVDVGEVGTLPQVVLLLQTGFYIGAAAIRVSRSSTGMSATTR